jgi:hypothetical protein
VNRTVDAGSVDHVADAASIRCSVGLWSHVRTLRQAPIRPELQNRITATRMIGASPIPCSPCEKSLSDAVRMIFLHAFTPAGERRENGGNQRRPAGLVTGTQSLSRFGVEVFIEQDDIAPMRVVQESVTTCITGPAPIGIDKKQSGKPTTNFIGNLGQIHILAGASRTFNAQ